MSDENAMDKLRWVRVFTPMHIPKYLVEQVRDRDYTSDEFYRYQEINCLRNTQDGPTLNPFSHLYVLADPDNLTKGFLWLTVDPLTKDIAIQTYSIDKEYWLKSKSVEKLATFVKFIKNKAKLNKIYWITNYPKHSERYGFKRSKSVLMEYKEEDSGKNIAGGIDSRGERRSLDTRTETVPSEHIGADCRASG